MNACLDQEKCSSWAALLAVLAMASFLPAQTDSGPATTSAFSAAPNAAMAPRCTFFGPECLPQSIALDSQPEPVLGDKPGEYAKNPAPTVAVKKSGRPDFNRSINYKNKLEFSVEGGWLPNNIPFVFDLMIGAGDRMTPLHYTLVPIIASLRWQVNNIGGPSILRGNWDFTFSGSYTMIPRGPETRYLAYMMGIRRNFVRPNWRIVPYLDGRVGMGDINAKEPYGVLFAQGQDLTFTVMLGGGARYNFNPRYSISAGVSYMHISNLYLSEPKYSNYGINVYGPMIGLNVQLGKRDRQPVPQYFRTK